MNEKKQIKMRKKIVIKKQKVKKLTFFSSLFMIPKELCYLHKAMGKDSTSPKHMLQK
jgi:hypothetical protein